jgi:hypothetical protein
VPHDALASLTEKAHASLTGVGASDHHSKTVSSEILLASMGEKSHASLTNVTADQHHASGDVRDSVMGVKTGIKAGTNVTIEDDGGYAKISSSGGVTDHGELTGLGDDDHTIYLKKAPDYDSGWFSISQDQAITKTHNLGTVNCLVDIQGKITGDVHEIHQTFIGICYSWDSGISANKQWGFQWYGLTTTQIAVYRGPNDDYAEQIKVRMWKLS